MAFTLIVLLSISIESFSLASGFSESSVGKENLIPFSRCVVSGLTMTSEEEEIAGEEHPLEIESELMVRGRESAIEG